MQKCKVILQTEASEQNNLKKEQMKDCSAKQD